MSNDTVRTLSCGQGVEIQDACRRQNVTLSELKLLTSGINLRRSIDFLMGASKKAGIVGLFDSGTFIGKDWSVVGERKALPEGWNPKQLVGISPLKSGENYIDGYEWKKRLAKKPLLGVDAFWTCWNNQQDIPEDLKSKIILFDGDELLDPLGSRCSLCLYLRGTQWFWDYYWLDDRRDAGYVSAVPAS